VSLRVRCRFRRSYKKSYLHFTSLLVAGIAFGVSRVAEFAEMLEVLKELSQRYDFVLLDTPAVLAVADARSGTKVDVCFCSQTYPDQTAGYRRTRRCWLELVSTQLASGNLQTDASMHYS
jgi:hypothetical protein